MAPGRGRGLDAPAALGPGDSRGRLRENKGRSIRASTPPIPARRVIGLDALGPVSAKTSPGEVWREGPGRATFAPDYGRRGRVWGVGAFEPATGLATTLWSPRRDRASCIPLLEQVLQMYPAREWGLLADHLRPQLSRDMPTALMAWPAVPLLCMPTSAGWLNRIEPWWKQQRSLARKGRRCAHVDEIIEAVLEATAYGNAHRYPYVWKKTA